MAPKIRKKTSPGPRAQRATSSKRRLSRAGQPTKLTRERVREAALRLIDERGLESFSLRDLARSLGVYPRAIYWYVRSRNDLLSEVVDYALRETYPPTTSTDWKDWLRKLFHQYRSAVQRHPNIAPLIGASILAGGGISSEMIERILTILNSAGFQDQQILDAYNVVVAAQVGFVTLELAALPLEDIVTWADAHRKRVSTIDVLRYPMLGRHLPAFANKAFALRWSNGTQVPLDSSFEKFVDVIIDGLEADLRRASVSSDGHESE